MKKCLLSLFVLGLALSLGAADRVRGTGADSAIVATPDDLSAGLLPGGSMLVPPSCGSTYSSGTQTMGAAATGKVTWTASGRLYRDGVPSTCPTAKAYPGPYSGGPWYYDKWVYDASTSDRCYQVNHNGGSCGGGYDCHDAVFCGDYPASGSGLPGSNPPYPNGFKGDTGSSPAANSVVSHNVCIPANTNFSLLFTNVYSMNACTYSWTLTCSTSSGVPCTADSACGASGPPPAGGGGTGGGTAGGTGGTCNLAPIEAKLDVIETKLDNGVGGDACTIYKLLNPRLPGKPDAAGSKCLGL